MSQILSSNDPQPFPLESQTIEYKEVFSTKIKKEIGALLNGRTSAYIYLGVNDQTRKITKQLTTEQRHTYEETISNWINDSYYPSAVGLVQIHSENTPFSIEIQPGINPPYYTDRRVYVRNNSSSEPASADTIRHLSLRNQLDAYDKEPATNQDLHFDYLKSKSQANHEQFDPKKFSNFLTTKNQYANTALLMSEENPFALKVAAFDGTTTRKFLDRKIFTGSIMEQIDQTMAYLSLNNHIQSTINGSQREDHYDYPTDALREGVTNAVAHRSYFDRGAVQVELYSDRIEILSPGPLPNGLTVPDILSGRSQPRNYNVLSILLHFNYMENFGTGIRRIEDSYAESKVKPLVKAGEGFVKLVLPNNNYVASSAKADHNEVPKLIPVGDDRQQIINYLENNPLARRSQVEKLLAIKSSQANRYLHTLVQDDIIRKVGSGRNTRYELVHKGSDH
ncbi:transcriptional regulator [Lentilactobacillus rapi DSM 19907 = JCM 15042]|uniref:ATPase AAA n=2 Tax=Lentilactobacillus rapi TaxID=481723 RepID=A0A512PNR5_9LACO|nr:ATP-binding protein [Lentilactobacillus rapi]KRL18255.1 transcriptional regulator [Lentilactobacillus rapi DSM 19907 = JCM 15042]GEP72848.1 ATPase AAA [Lentilactobacillus rapi]